MAIVSAFPRRCDARRQCQDLVLFLVTSPRIRCHLACGTRVRRCHLACCTRVRRCHLACGTRVRRCHLACAACAQAGCPLQAIPACTLHASDQNSCSGSGGRFTGTSTRKHMLAPQHLLFPPGLNGSTDDERRRQEDHPGGACDRQQTRVTQLLVPRQRRCQCHGRHESSMS